MLGALLAALAVPVLAQDADMDRLIAELEMRETRVASRDMDGWRKPAKIAILVTRDMPEAGLGSRQWLREAAGDTELVFVEGGGDMSPVADADAFFGWCVPAALAAGKRLRYLHFYSAGVDRCAAIPGIADRGFIVTNSAKAASETIAEHSIAMLLSLTRNLYAYRDEQAKAHWAGSGADAPDPVSVQGRTMLVLGLGGIGTQTAKRGHALGMRVIGTRNSSRSGPDYVAYVGLSNETNELAKQADVVVNALPLTETTAGIVDATFFANLKKGSYYISVGRGPTTDTGALMDALANGTLNGAGLDVTDPEPLPENHPLWTMKNVIITPHEAGSSDLSGRNTLLIARENLRRYIEGEKLLNPVDLQRGY